jgi:hypothetical protein
VDRLECIQSGQESQTALIRAHQEETQGIQWEFKAQLMAQEQPKGSSGKGRSPHDNMVARGQVLQDRETHVLAVRWRQ